MQARIFYAGATGLSIDYFLLFSTAGGEELILDNIRRLCRERSLTFKDLERRTGIGNGVIAKWAKCSPRVDTLKKVADYFGVSLDDLLSDRNN
jgi:hypothetical protein